MTSYFLIGNAIIHPLFPDGPCAEGRRLCQKAGGLRGPKGLGGRVTNLQNQPVPPLPTPLPPRERERKVGSRMETVLAKVSINTALSGISNPQGSGREDKKRCMQESGFFRWAGSSCSHLTDACGRYRHCGRALGPSEAGCDGKPQDVGRGASGAGRRRFRQGLEMVNEDQSTISQMLSMGLLARGRSGGGYRYR